MNDIYKEFYIFDPEVYKKITNLSDNNKEDINNKEIDKDSKFWKINILRAELGG